MNKENRIARKIFPRDQQPDTDYKRQFIIQKSYQLCGSHGVIYEKCSEKEVFDAMWRQVKNSKLNLTNELFLKKEDFDIFNDIDPYLLYNLNFKSCIEDFIAPVKFRNDEFIILYPKWKESPDEIKEKFSKFIRKQKEYLSYMAGDIQISKDKNDVILTDDLDKKKFRVALAPQYFIAKILWRYVEDTTNHTYNWFAEAWKFDPKNIDNNLSFRQYFKGVIEDVVYRFSKLPA